MLKAIREVSTKVVVFVSYGNVTHTETGITCDTITDVLPDCWGTNDGYEMITVDMDIPSDYVGEAYKLVEDGDGYRFDPVS